MKLLKPGTGFPDTRDVEGHRQGYRPLPGRLTGALVVALALLGAVCAAPSATASDPTPTNRIDVSMRDFKLKVSRSAVPAGVVVIRVHNRGPSTHEINVDRTDLPSGALPLKADGLTVDEDSPALHRVDSIEQLNLGDSGDLKLRLKPGHYVLYCNLEGHYLGGMHVDFDVASPAR